MKEQEFVVKSSLKELEASITQMERRLLAEMKELQAQLIHRFAAMVGVWATLTVAILGTLIIRS